MYTFRDITEISQVLFDEDKERKYCCKILSISVNKKMVMAVNYMHTHQSSDGAHEILIGLLPLLGCPIGPDKRKY